MTYSDSVAAAARGSALQSYLDTPSMGLPTASAVTAMHAAIDSWGAGRGQFHAWERSMETCRSLFARMFDVTASEVGLLPSVVPAVSAVGATIARGNGLVVAHRKEFRSLLLPVLAQVGEQRIRWVDGPYVADTFTRAVDRQTDAVIVSAVSSHDGGRPCLARLKEACVDVGARLVVDGTQAAGIVVPDVPLRELSLFVCAGYKGLRGPRGVAYAVAHDDAVAAFAAPSAYGMSDSEERGSYGPPLLPKDGAAGLDQSPAWLAWVAAEPALAELVEQPATQRQARILALAGRVRYHVEELGLDPQETDLPSSIVSFETEDPEGLVSRFAQAGIRASCRLGRVRLGFHIYNSAHDVDLVCQELDRISVHPRNSHAKEPQI